MSPYYQDAFCTLYHGDCRDVLPTLAPADLMIADPPYCVGWQSGKGNHELIAGDDGSLPIEAWLEIALRRVKRGRHVYIFGIHANQVPGGVSLCAGAELIWDKSVMGLGDLSSPWGQSHESILFGVQEISRANRAKNYGVGAARLRKGSILKYQRPHSGQTLRHPTEKPVDLLRVLIESSSTFGETVLDPFAGVGSTLEAATREGRMSVGIELEERFCEIAARRLEALTSTSTSQPLAASDQPKPASPPPVVGPRQDAD